MVLTQFMISSMLVLFCFQSNSAAPLCPLPPSMYLQYQPLAMSDEFFCPDEDGFFPFDDQCTGDYYVCVGGNYAIQKCPPANVFDPLNCYCTSLDLASCNGMVASSTTSRTTLCEDFTCPGTPGTYPDLCDCSKFYQCNDSGVVFPQFCSPGLAFNPISGTCDLPSNVPGCEV